jgi:two-component sensor histidine kinase
MQNLVTEKEELLQERNILAAELQHRVRNNLQLVYGMLLRQIESDDNNSKEGMRSIARRVMSLAAIYDHLLGHGLVQTMDFGAYLKTLCASLRDFQEKGQFDITLICEAEPMVLELDLVTSLGIIVTEIASNAYIHAFPTGPGTIKITLLQKDNKGILTIADDGIGFVEKKTSKRYGVGLVKRLMEQAKGEAVLKSDAGTIWTLVFPLELSADMKRVPLVPSAGLCRAQADSTEES